MKRLICILIFLFSLADLSAQIFKQNYSWQYEGKEYSTELILNTRTYNYYKHYEKRLLFTREQVFENLLTIKDNDNLIRMLCEKLKIIARKNKISDDKLPELAAAFVQYIPYDSAKASKILAEKWDSDTDLYFHYETLYLGRGVCTDKSILLVSILQYFGYGSSLVLMNSEHHAAAAIYSRKSGINKTPYLYIETTAPAPIGFIPKGIDISNAEIIRKRTGKIYEKK